MLAGIHRETLNKFGIKKKPFFFCIDYSGNRMEIFAPEEAQANGFRFSFPQFSDNYRYKKVTLRVHPPHYEVYRQRFAFLQKKIGDGYSVLANLTWAVPITCDVDIEEIYLAARAPYRILKKDEFVCFSPETFVKILGERIETRPMKGTRKAANKEMVTQVAAELLNDIKETAEHYAVTDLLRNDLNQVARNVKVERFRYVETLVTAGGFLLQSSSLISGKITADWPARLGDIFSCLLPAGSVTGAPKRETVHLLKNCEIQQRGWYCGVAGYFDGTSLDSCVLIRFIEKNKEGYFFRTGGGITFDSDPRQEYEELLQKVYVPLY